MIKRISLFALLLLTQYTFAQIPKPQKNTYVNDFAHVLSKDQVNSLNKQIYTIEKASTVQVAIVLVKTVPAKYTIDKFAVQIGRKWNVGKAHNGIVYVAAINQHKQRIELDSASLQKITSLEQEWLLNDIKPYFKQNDYYGGLTNLTQQLNKYLTPPPALGAEPVAQKAKPAEPEETVIWPLFLILGMVVAFVWLIIYVIKRMIRDVRENRAAGLYSSSSSGGSFFSRRRYRNRWGNDHYYHTTNNYYESQSSTRSSRDDDDDDDNRPSNWGNWGSSSDNDDSDDDKRRSSSSSSSGGSFSNSGGSTSDW
ncbi:TPM domain-containing protein [Mucilaginibacter sp. CAU 1740]|uniref:TPM domain-containing protein n=1 Tax=Mucilaginibacter sp. CAU 1740 TaxID=3140365 RepID=UPI00325ADD0D